MEQKKGWQKLLSKHTKNTFSFYVINMSDGKLNLFYDSIRKCENMNKRVILIMYLPEQINYLV